MHGDILVSLRQNPLVLLLGVPAAIWLVCQTFCPKRRIKWTPPGWIGWSVLAVVLVFWVIRNLPLAALDTLRPIQATAQID